MTIKIDPEFEQQIPPLKPEEFDQLEKNILEDGVILNPLILWNGTLVDGHNRYRIAEKHPHIQYTIAEKEFPDRYSVLAWICKNQLGRRNLTKKQIEYLLGKQYEAEKKGHGGDRKSDAQKSSSQNESLISSKDKTSSRIAKEHNVSRATVYRAHDFSKAVDIADELSPGFKTQLLSGELSPSSRDVQAIVKAKPEERPALIEQIKHPEKKQPSKKEKPFDLMQKIADDMLETHGTGTPSDMFCELEDALDSLIFRWSMCLRTYETYYTDNKHRGKINKLAEDGRLFLSQIQGGTIPE
jgi:hypothetical protein